MPTDTISEVDFASDRLQALLQRAEEHVGAAWEEVATATEEMHEALDGLNAIRQELEILRFDLVLGDPDSAAAQLVTDKALAGGVGALAEVLKFATRKARDDA